MMVSFLLMPLSPYQSTPKACSAYNPESGSASHLCHQVLKAMEVGCMWHYNHILDTLILVCLCSALGHLLSSGME